MGKKDKFDLISDAHERAEHNINPYYWFNRVTSFTLAEIRASLSFAWIDFLLITGLAIAMILNIRHLTNSWQGITALIILFVFWIISILRFARWIALRNEKPSPTIKPKERKKKLPKRPKNYGRN